MCESRDNAIAVYVKDLCFSYLKNEPILNQNNLIVNKANIYGLLGPSGCGKTTLLKCILGRLKAKSGVIKVFGAEPGSPECHIPGPGVGYMPQESGLYMEFTIDEILIYFGKIYSMKRFDIKEKSKQIIKLLNLPEDQMLIGNLSGGQKRRVSLACALIHSPPLMILDEPTVGTDPILRNKIGCHLETLCKSGITIILTTHYIEEARTADVVAFIRKGRILVEDNPNTLIKKYQTTTLEEVFLKLCQTNHNKNQTFDIEVQNQSFCYENEIITDEMVDENNENTKPEICDSQDQINNNHNNIITFAQNDKKIVYSKENSFSGICSALLMKNYKRLTRNWINLCIYILMPALELAIALYSLGDGITNLKIAISNQEKFNNNTNNLGQLFINSIDKHRFHLVDFDSFEEAIHSVESGQTYAVIEINERFSKAFRLRVLYGSDADNETLEESQIRTHIDWSNQMVALQVERYLYEAFIKFGEEMAIRSDINPNTIKIPLVFEKPVYGIRKESLKDYVLPGFFVLMSFFVITIISGNMFIEERRDGLLERTFVAGVSLSQILLVHILTLFLMLCTQTVFLLIMPFLVFGIRLTGSLTLLISLIISQGLCGTAFGIILSILSNTDGLYFGGLSMLVFLVSIVMGGIFWPIEALPIPLQYLGQFMPTTLAINSMRYILYREWSLTHYEVYIGFVVTYLWIAFFVLIALKFAKTILY